MRARQLLRRQLRTQDQDFHAANHDAEPRTPLFKRDRDMPPHLDRQNHRRREQQRAHRHMRHGRDHHGQLRLHGISSPGHARQERGEAQAQLRDDQRQHENRRTPDRVNSRINRQRADCRPCQHERHDHRMYHVRPPTQSVVPEHRSQNQLHVQHEDRKQRQCEQAGPALVELRPVAVLPPICGR